MKDDYGKVWKIDDYLRGLFLIFLITFLILLPVYFFVVAMSLFNNEPQIIFWSTISILVLSYGALIVFTIKKEGVEDDNRTSI